MTVLTDIGTYLDGQSASITLSTNFFYSLLPETPDNCVALISEGGPSPLFTMGTTNTPTIERPQIQLLVRNTSYATGEALIDALYRILTAISNQSLSGTTYLRVEAMSFPALIERDQSKRVLFSCNFDVQRLTP